jgi:hypothetical protein
MPIAKDMQAGKAAEGGDDDLEGSIDGATSTAPDPLSGSGKARAKAAALAVRVQDSSSVWMSPEALQRWEQNPRENDPNVPNVAASIERFGFVNPIVVWKRSKDLGGDRMVAGDTRLKAMKLLLATHGPKFTAKGAPGPGLCRVVFHDFDNEHEANLYALADNRLNELSKWDGKRLDEVLADYDDDDRAIAGFRKEHVEQVSLEVREVDVEELVDQSFSLTVRGPLPAQADVLDKLRDTLESMPGIEVTFGAG